VLDVWWVSKSVFRLPARIRMESYHPTRGRPESAATAVSKTRGIRSIANPPLPPVKASFRRTAHFFSQMNSQMVWGPRISSESD
jgi:hypothetical protein